MTFKMGGRGEEFEGTSEITPQIKAFVIKFDDSDFVPSIHRAAGKNRLPQ